jgi:hypothetical protein
MYFFSSPNLFDSLKVECDIKARHVIDEFRGGKRESRRWSKRLEKRLGKFYKLLKENRAVMESIQRTCATV